MRIIESYAMIKRKQTKFPRKKNNKRWQKKYAKKYSIQVPRADCMISETEGLIICHPIVAATIRKEFANQSFHADTQSHGGLGKMECNCGGIAKTHHVGNIGCFRERVFCQPRKISCEKDRWFVDGHTVTGTTLREQRMYHQHSCGKWSRPIGVIKANRYKA